MDARRTAIAYRVTNEVDVLSATAFIGAISVLYTVRASTQDPNMHGQGRYLLTVRDVPTKVSTPTASAGDLQATVSWATPATNGEPINSVVPKGQATAPTSLSLSGSTSGNGQINVSWGADSISSKSATGSARATSTLTVTVTVNGASNSTLAFATTSAVAPTSWSGNRYLFSGSGYTKAEGWYVKDSTISSISGSPPHC